MLVFWINRLDVGRDQTRRSGWRNDMVPKQLLRWSNRCSYAFVLVGTLLAPSRRLREWGIFLNLLQGLVVVFALVSVNSLHVIWRKVGIPVVPNLHWNTLSLACLRSYYITYKNKVISQVLHSEAITLVMMLLQWKLVLVVLLHLHLHLHLHLQLHVWGTLVLLLLHVHLRHLVQTCLCQCPMQLLVPILLLHLLVVIQVLACIQPSLQGGALLALSLQFLSRGRPYWLRLLQRCLGCHIGMNQANSPTCATHWLTLHIVVGQVR